MNKIIRKRAGWHGLTTLLFICLLLGLAVSSQGVVSAQDEEPPPDPIHTPETEHELPVAPVPEMEDDLIQELTTEELQGEFNSMAEGFAYRVANIYPGSLDSSPRHLQVFNNKLYFSACTNDNKGHELWVYNGSNPPYRVADICPGVGSSDPLYLQVFNNKLFFQADGCDGKGHELWAYDGTNAPYRVADIFSTGIESSYPKYLKVFNNKLFFQADGGDGAGKELWAYDGSNPPYRVADIYSGSSWSQPSFLQVFNNQLYFQANGGDSAGQELWVYDGSNPPSCAADIYTGSEGSALEYLQVFNNQLYFGAFGADSAGKELWAYDGSSPPYRVADIYPGSYSSLPRFMHVFNNKLYFQADSGDGKGVELWVYDGSSSPYRVLDINSSSSSSPSYLHVFNNRLYFSANGGDGAGVELWAYMDIPVITNFFRSSATNDGWVLESARTSNKGGTLNKTAATLSVGDDAKNRQYRAILHFNTASLPDNAVITSVKLQVKRAGIAGTNPFNTHGALYVDMRKGAFSNNPALQAADWQAAASKLAAGRIPKTSASSWHTLNLAAANLKYINKKGVTQLRLRFNKQDNGDNGADYVNFYSGNAGAANRPKLIITYYVP